jgi:2'-hydroxyisoflavone reductase
MRLLVLGGTVFLGRHVVEAALARGHVVTLFNRGQHNPDLFPNVEKLRGNRDGDLTSLLDKRWDVVIDTSAHLPRVVRASVQQLAGAVDCYILISSISAYRDFPSTPGIDESWPVSTLADPTTEEIKLETLGPLKALCEEAVEEAMAGRVLTIRPGLIVGPFDPTGRFTYWPRRVAQGGEVLVPGEPGLLVQIIDARDLAVWILRMVENGQTGTYNASGPGYPLTMRQLLEACKGKTESDASFTWVDEEFLLESGITMLPLWIPGAPGAATVNCSKAIAAGLTFRPLADTVGDTLAWDGGVPSGAVRRLGLNREREVQLLHAWRSRREPATSELMQV